MNSEFIVKIRKSVNNIKRINDEDIIELGIKMSNLIKVIENTIINHPEIGLQQLRSNFNEIRREFDYTETMVLQRLSELSKEGKDDTFLDYANTKEIGLKNEEALSYLLELLLTYFPEVAKNHKSQFKRFLPNKYYLLEKYEPTQLHNQEKKYKENFLRESKEGSSKENPYKRSKFIANEKALSYVFDLWANGEKTPTNRVEGGHDAKEIKRIGMEKGFEKPDTFYRAVKTVLKYDLNSTKQLECISKDWLNAVKSLSTNWVKTREYLVKKNLIRE